MPPHLDPRQPHFRPPSPGAASVLSVAVHPPVSPKLHGMSRLGSTGSIGGSGLATYNHRGVSDSGEEPESFENGALTPTLSDELDEDESMDKHKGGLSLYDSSPTPSPSIITDGSNPFNFNRLQLASGPQVSFDPNVLSHEAVGSVSGGFRAPSIAATAGSSRAPSARGLSPPGSLSRATTTEGSFEEFDSTGTGMGESGAETPSIIRSRRSSYSAPSSEVEGAGLEAGADAGPRARGATLTSNANALSGGIGSNHAGDEGDDNLRDGPSLAPSEAGSDSTRSMTQDSSSLGHGLYPYPSGGSSAAGGPGGSSDRLAQYPSSSLAFAGSSSPGTFEPPSPGEFFLPAKGALHPTLPSLLAIKKANRRNGSGAASTAATAGTASPTSSLSVDGDYEEAIPAGEQSAVEQ